MSPDRANFQLWMMSVLLALATSFGSLVTLSFGETAKSEESKVELTELAEIEVDSEEEKIVDRRERRIRRRSIVHRQHKIDTANSSYRVADSRHIRSSRLSHNGCGSHLRI